MSLCLRAFEDCSTARQIGMGLGQLPWPVAIQWCSYHLLDRDATGIVLAVLRRLDRDFLEREHSRQKGK